MRRYKSDMLPAQPNQSLIDGLSCLHAVIAAGEPIGCREVGRRLELERTRANRLLGTWRHLGLLEQNDAAKYAPGPGLHVLAGMSLRASGLLRAALPEIRRWWREAWTVSLAVRWQDRLCFLVHLRPDMAVEDGIGSRATAPALQSSAGLALLAQVGVRERQAWDLATAWREVGDGRDLDAVLTRAAADGHASRLYGDGTRSVGVPVDSGYAALAVSQRELSTRAVPGVAERLRASVAAIRATLADDALAAPLNDVVIPA